MSMVSILTETSVKGISNRDSGHLRRTLLVEPECSPADSCSATHGDIFDPTKAELVTVIGLSSSRESITPAAMAASVFKSLIERHVYSQSTLCF